MKIRTDFVTNSSSSNYVTINIKSPKLTEIIRGARVCKENGETDGDEWDEYGYDRLKIDESEQIVKLMLEISHIISRCDADMEQTDEADLKYIGYPPENLSVLPESLLRLLKEVGEYTLRRLGYDLAKICSALEKNGEDILADTKSADWTYDTEGHGEANLFTWFWNLSRSIAKKENLDYRPSSASLLCSFHYDEENGESFKGEYSYGEPNKEDFTDDDWDFEMEFSEDDLESEIGFFEEDEDVLLIQDDFTEEDE